MILADEPTSALDPITTRSVLACLREINERFQVTIVIVTHEMGFAQKVADRIVFMDKGAIIEENTPQEFFSHPKTDRARAFLNIIDDYEV